MKRILSILFFVVLSSNSFAQGFFNNFNADIYGKLFFHGYYTKQDSKNTGLGTDIYNADFALEKQSRLGVKLDFVNLSGVFEIGADTNTSLRLFYIKYDFFDEGSLTIGQDWTIAGYSFGQTVLEDNELQNYGALVTNRKPQLTYKNDGFKLAFVSSQGNNENDLDNILKSSNKRLVSYAIPYIEVAYNIDEDELDFDIFGAYRYYSATGFSNTLAKTEYSLNAFTIGIGGSFEFDDFFIKYTGWGSMNGTLIGSLTDLDLQAIFNTTDGKFYNTLSYGGALGIGYTFEGFIITVTPQIGGGYIYSENDKFLDTNNKKITKTAMSAYINIVVKVNEWLSITPEVSWFNKNNYVKGNGSSIYAGAKASVEF